MTKNKLSTRITAAILCLLFTFFAVPVAARAEAPSDLTEELTLLAEHWNGSSREKDAQALLAILQSLNTEELWEIYQLHLTLPGVLSPDEAAEKITDLIGRYYRPSDFYNDDGTLSTALASKMLRRCYTAALTASILRATLKRRAIALDKQTDPDGALAALLTKGEFDCFALALAQETYELGYVKEHLCRTFAMAAEDVSNILCEKFANAAKADAKNLTAYLIRSYSLALGDTYASYQTVEEVYEELQDDAVDYVGVGLTVSVNSRGSVVLLHVSPESPAQKAGLLPGDVLLTVDGVAIHAENFNEILRKVHGESGTEVSLSLERNGLPFSVTLTRAACVNYTAYGKMLEGNIGYVRITQFSDSTCRQLIEATTALEAKGARAFIFDVRDNPGGLLTSVVSILAWVLPSVSTDYPNGDIVHLQYKNKFYTYNEAYTMATGNLTYKEMQHSITVPITVLCNEKTASAAELFASTLQDWQHGTVIGTQTFGKGMGQTPYVQIGYDERGCIYGEEWREEYPGARGPKLLVSACYYAPAGGMNYEGVGVVPNETVAPGENWKGESSFLIPEEEDDALKTARMRAEQMSNDAQSKLRRPQVILVAVVSTVFIVAILGGGIVLTVNRGRHEKVN